MPCLPALSPCSLQKRVGWKDDIALVDIGQNQPSHNLTPGRFDPMGTGLIIDRRSSGKFAWRHFRPELSCLKQAEVLRNLKLNLNQQTTLGSPSVPRPMSTRCQKYMFHKNNSS